MKNRLKILRNKASLTQEAAAKNLGVAKQTWVKWEGGSNAFKPVWYERAAKVLNCHPTEFFAEIVETVSVPIISWVQAGEFTDFDTLTIDDGQKTIASTYIKNSTFALNVVGNSMDRIAPQGSVIIVDYEDKDLIDGKYYIIRNGNGASFKRYRAEPMRFEPHSTQDHDIIFPHDGLFIVGRVVQVMTEI